MSEVGTSGTAYQGTVTAMGMGMEMAEVYLKWDGGWDGDGA